MTESDDIAALRQDLVRRFRTTTRELELAGRQTDEARSGLAHKIAQPLSILLMPLLAAVAAFATSFGLIAYDSWFLRKTRTLR